MLDAAFDGADWHALLGNLRDVAADEWRWTPPGGSRALRDIVQHVGSSKLMYANHAFGDATCGWEQPRVQGGAALDTAATAVAWLRDCQALLRRGIANLDDAALSAPRLTNWGEQRETRWIVTVMLQHDLYHAGEINHLRALFRNDDVWEHERRS